MQLKSLVETGRHDLIYFSANPLALCSGSSSGWLLSWQQKDCSSSRPHIYTPYHREPERDSVSKNSQQKSLWTKIISCSVAKSCLTLWPHGLQHTRLPCPSLSPGACLNSCPWIGDAIQPSHPLSSPSPPALSLSQHQDLFQWVGSLHQMAKGLEPYLQHQSFQWVFRVDFL